MSFAAYAINETNKLDHVWQTFFQFTLSPETIVGKEWKIIPLLSDRGRFLPSQREFFDIEVSTLDRLSFPLF